MERAEVLRFLGSNHRGVLATYRRDATVQMSPVVAGVDHEGLVVISTREGAAKTANLRRDPRAGLVTFTDNFFGPWAMVWGTVEVVSLPAALPLLEDYYRLVAGEHRDWSEYRRAMVAERRVLLRMTVAEAGPRRLG
ncbi:MAG: TIGR03618 family F420-dependent PPOX class oxidoreductase [Candidatus Dormibacteraeota bacterium]|nr:TIGR03618 family F420-dependent PPOX class oxidoreductase [Candidatus Dormibacteraeota bacterium]